MVSWRVAMMQHVASLDLSDNPVLGVVQGPNEDLLCCLILTCAIYVICSGYSRAMLMCLLHSHLLWMNVLCKFKLRAAAMCQQVAVIDWMRISSTSCHACSAAARSGCCACSTQARRPIPCLHSTSCCTLQIRMDTACGNKPFTS